MLRSLPPRFAACATLWLLAVLVAHPLPAQDANEGETIREIRIDGIDREREKELLGRMKIRVGARYSRDAVTREAGKLFSLGLFRRIRGPFVTAQADGVSVRFEVEEKPRIVAVRFSGRDALSDSELRGGSPSLRTRESEHYNEYFALQDVDTLREKYVEKGYLFVQVEHRVDEVSGGVAITFVIHEGTRARVHEIRFSGNRHFDADTLLGLMRTRVKDTFFFGLWDSGFYNHRDLQLDVVTLKRHYRANGFLDVEVEPQAIEPDETKERLRIDIRIEEGVRYVFRGYEFRGNKVFSRQVLEGLTTAPVGKPFSASLMERDRDAILDYYKDRAYIFAEAREDYFDRYETNEVTIVFEIEENSEVYIDKIKVSGNVKTQDRVIRRELEFYPGERVDKSKLDKSRSNLARLGIFQDIQYSYEDSDLPSSKNLVVNVQEADSGQLIVGFGVTSGFGLIGNFQYSKQNFDMSDWPESFYDLPDAFTGAGQTFNIVAQPGTLRSRYRLTFVEPYLFDTRNALSLTVQSLDLFREDWEEERLLLRAQITHAFDFDRDLALFFGIRFEEIEIGNVEPDAPQDAFDVEGHTTVVASSIGMRYDKRLIEPFEGAYDGHLEEISYDFAGKFLGGHVDYHAVRASQDLYFPLYTHRDGNYHHVIAMKNTFGWMRPLDSGDTIPLFERFYLGGPQDVRGFRFRGLGPHQRGEPVGATQEYWGNLEYSFPIFQKLLRGVFWFDWGNLENVSAFRVRDTRLAAGGGIRINFPFFGGRPLPIGLYFGSPIHSEPGDETRFFLFTIGDSF